MQWRFPRDSLSPCYQVPYQNIQETLTKRYPYHQSSNLCDSTSTQITIIECKQQDPLFDDSLWSAKVDLAEHLFSDGKQDRTTAFKNRFMVGRQVGSGSYSSVRHCVDRNTLKSYALKIYNKQIISDSRTRSILREVRILQMIKHTNVIKIYETIQTNNHINLLLELVDGQPLNNYKAIDLKSIIFQVAQALNHMHNKQITHRDIKLENILICNDKQVKIIDFGFATLLSNHSRKKIYCGTPNYMAPEIIKRLYYRGPPVDIWALGVVLYVLKLGHFPPSHYKRNNQIDDPYLQDLLNSMFMIDPNQRITASEILMHSWFSERTIPKSPRYILQQSTIKKKDSLELIYQNTRTSKRSIVINQRESIFNQIY